jgi:hexosaminidase
LIRGFSTLIQIFGSSDDIIVLTSLPIRIKDAPRFEYRGLMIDTARRYLSKKIILRLLDSMMLSKLNILHWHITDDDSFPMYLKSYPELVYDTAFKREMIYTPETINEIIQYAETKGIRVIPDVNTVTHIRSLGLYKPLNSIVTCFNSLKSGYMEGIAKGPPKGALDPSMNLTYEFTKKLLTDVLGYFKDQYVYLGGNDVPSVCWDERPDIRKFMKEHKLMNYDELVAYYFNKESEVLKELDGSRKPVFWLSEAEFTIKHQPEAILHYRGHSKNINRLKALYPKNKFIMSPYDFVFTDCGLGNAYGGSTWCDPFHTWSKMYNFEPTNYGIEQNRILGGEVCAFSEVLNEDNIEAVIWPRAASYAALLWEPKRTGIADLPKLVQDLNNFSLKLKEIGARTSPITGKFCGLAENECFIKY